MWHTSLTGRPQGWLGKHASVSSPLTLLENGQRMKSTDLGSLKGHLFPESLRLEWVSMCPFPLSTFLPGPLKGGTVEGMNIVMF